MLEVLKIKGSIDAPFGHSHFRLRVMDLHHEGMIIFT
jgi:hypothetical protein